MWIIKGLHLSYNVITCHYICVTNDLKVISFHNMSKQISSQKDQVAALLQGLKESATASDRRDAGKKYKLSHVTVHRYLNGQVHDLDLGLKLLSFFKEKRDSRQNQIKELSAA